MYIANFQKTEVKPLMVSNHMVQTAINSLTQIKNNIFKEGVKFYTKNLNWSLMLHFDFFLNFILHFICQI